MTKAADGGAAVGRLRLLPPVDLVVRAVLEGVSPPAPSRSEVTRAARTALEELRLDLAPVGRAAPSRLEAPPTRDSLLARAVAATRRVLAQRARTSPRRVVNATGVVLHTNLGRARLAPEAVRAAALAGGHVNLELSLQDGSRLSRQAHVSGLLTTLTGAEDALVVNNNAAAVWLCLRNLARGRAVLISRGELVEIGESFRLPDIMAEAGVRLAEVGTTNRTTVDDYRRALAAGGPGFLSGGPGRTSSAPGLASGGPEPAAGGVAREAADRPAAIVLVHPSNYRVVGFASRPLRRDVVALAREAGVPVVEDLGSGALFRLDPWGLPGEPTPREAIAEGVDLVTFSGDKLLGGPQAGIVAGKRDLVTRLRADPILRCLRPDKITLAALEATLRLYGDPAADPGPALTRVPALRALTEPVEAVHRRAARALRLVRARLPRRSAAKAADRGAEPVAAADAGEVVGAGADVGAGAVVGADAAAGFTLSLAATTTEAGGGSLPASELPTWAIAVTHASLSPDELWRRLAAAEPPVVGRRHHDALLLDLRSVADEEVAELAGVLADVLKGGAHP